MALFNNTSLAESSRKLFSAKLEQFLTFMPRGSTIESIIDNPENAKKALEKQTTIAQTEANKHMFYSAVVAYLKHTDDGKRRSNKVKEMWTKVQKDNWEQRRKQGLDNEPLENQVEVAENIKWQDIILKRDSLKTPSIEKLLLSLYTYLPPVRADYYEVRINPPKSIIEDKKSNYLILKETPELSTIVLRDFKTAAKYKEIKHTLTKPLYDEIQASLKQKPRSYLFTMPSDNKRPYDRNSFSKWANKTLKELFQHPVTLTTLRHLFVSTIDFNKTRGSELEKIGNAMGHSIAMQKGYQWIEK
jgi:hypothetical protein